jgi:transcriptional regulator with XRE-family HTH domain
LRDPLGTPGAGEATAGWQGGAVLLRLVIGNCLRRARHDQGRTLQDVAEAAGVSIGHLSEVERGRKEPSSEVLAAICRALGLQLSDLLRDVQRELEAAPAPGRLLLWSGFDLAA